MHGSHPASSGAPRDSIARPEAPRLPPRCVSRTRPNRHTGLLGGCPVGPLRGARCRTHHDDRDRAGGAFSTPSSLRAVAHDGCFPFMAPRNSCPPFLGTLPPGEYLRQGGLPEEVGRREQAEEEDRGLVQAQKFRSLKNKEPEALG